MANVKPAGTNRLGYMSESSPVVLPPKGKRTASIFMPIMKINPIVLMNLSVLRFINDFVLSDNR